MTLVRWEPFGELNSLQRQMNHLFDDFLSTSDWKTPMNSGFTPAVELTEDDMAYRLKLEIPGMEVEDLDIQATAESISIRGERRTENKTEKDGVTHSEFRYGTFHRVIPLARRINHQAVDANYQDGILTMTLPKVEEEQNKVVKVSVN